MKLRSKSIMLLTISIIAICLLLFYLNYHKREHFSVVFYGDKPKEINIPAKYPKYQQGPCLRKNKNGLVSWGNLTGEDPGNCDYHAETTLTATPKQSTPTSNLTRTPTLKPNTLLDTQGNLKKGKINQLLGITDSSSSNSFCTTSKNLESLNNKCQSLYPDLGPNVGVKEVEPSGCTSGDKVICETGYFMGNKLSQPNAEVIGCKPISSNFNSQCQNKFGRRVGYKQLNKNGCNFGYQWAECSPLYYDGLPVYDKYVNGEQKKATLCYPDNNMDNFTQACQEFGSDWNVNSFITDYCKPGNLRALCSNSSTSLPTTPGENGNVNSSSETKPYLPNSCPCAP